MLRTVLVYHSSTPTPIYRYPFQNTYVSTDCHIRNNKTAYVTEPTKATLILHARHLREIFHPNIRTADRLQKKIFGKNSHPFLYKGIGRTFDTVKRIKNPFKNIPAAGITDLLALTWYFHINEQPMNNEIKFRAVIFQRFRNQFVIWYVERVPTSMLHNENPFSTFCVLLYLQQQSDAVSGSI